MDDLIQVQTELLMIRLLPNASPSCVPKAKHQAKQGTSFLITLHVIACGYSNTLHSFNPQRMMARRRRPPRPGALADLSPSRILKQIALLQFFYYGVAIVLIVFTTFVAGRHPDTNAILDWRELRSDVTTGWTLALCWLLGSLITYVACYGPSLSILIFSR